MRVVLSFFLYLATSFGVRFVIIVKLGIVGCEILLLLGCQEVLFLPHLVMLRLELFCFLAAVLRLFAGACLSGKGRHAAGLPSQRATDGMQLQHLASRRCHRHSWL